MRGWILFSEGYAPTPIKDQTLLLTMDHLDRQVFTTIHGNSLFLVLSPIFSN